ncbi:MAG TPA: AAA family ATPase, partial [Nitrolancea sp.]|nr:AAA family ATPase [Nitrolancea sp.]
MAGSDPTCGELLRRYRLLAGLTQEELAERSAYSTDYISKLERDQRRPPLDAVNRLAVALGLSDQAREDLRAARVRQDTPGTSAESRGPVGRERELAEIRRQLSGLGSRVLLLAGEPGIGKTRLLAAAAIGGAQSGWRVIQGGCRRSAQDPYAPFTDALARSIQGLPPLDRATVLRRAGELRALLPELADEDDGGAGFTGALHGPERPKLEPQQERRLLFAAVARYLHDVAGEAGTLLVLDDLQWAGPDALDLLASLAGSPDLSIRIVGAYRDTEPTNAPLGGLVADLARASLVRVLNLGPLSESEATELLSELVPDDRRLRALLPSIVRRTGGVPFFLVSYAEDLQLQAGHEMRRELPWTVEQVIRQRVVALPESVQRLLAVAALVGRIVPPTLLRQVIGLTEEVVLTDLETAAAARLLAEEGEDSYRFTHDLIRETIEQNLSLGRRRLLHRRIGEALEQDQRTPVATLAFHFAGSDDDGKAMRYLALAGDEARQRAAHAAAADYYREALGYSEHVNPANTAALAEKLGVELYLSGRYDESIAALERALEHTQAGDEESMRRVSGRVADVHFRRGTGREVHDRVAALLTDAGTGDASLGGNLGSALRQAFARLLFEKGTFKQLLAFGRSLKRLGRASRNRRLLIFGERAEGTALIQLGRLAEGVAILEPALSRGLAAGEHDRMLEVAFVLTSAYLSMGAVERGLAISRQMLSQAEVLNDPVITAGHFTFLGVGFHLSGDWAEARSYFQRADALFAAAAPSSIAARLANLRAHTLIWEGRWDEAQRRLESAQRAVHAMGFRNAERRARTLLAELDLYRGRSQAAIDRLAPFAHADNLNDSAVHH